MTPTDRQKIAIERLDAIVDARVEAQIPSRLMEALLPYSEEMEVLRRRLDLVESKNKYLAACCALLMKPKKKLRDDWAARRAKENGRPRVSACIDCGNPSRGVRCLSCFKAGVA